MKELPSAWQPVWRPFLRDVSAWMLTGEACRRRVGSESEPMGKLVIAKVRVEPKIDLGKLLRQPPVGVGPGHPKSWLRLIPGEVFEQTATRPEPPKYGARSPFRSTLRQ